MAEGTTTIPLPTQAAAGGSGSSPSPPPPSTTPGPTPPFPPLLDAPQVYLPAYPRQLVPPPRFPLRFPPHFYSQPCKCDLSNQIRYYNHKDRDFFYHTAVRLTTPSPLYDGDSDGGDLLDPGVTPTPKSPPVPPYARYFDPYGPVAPPLAPVPPDYHPSRQQGGYYRYFYQDAGLCEGVIVLLALLLWLYSFYRLYLVWQNTLNFSESSIQGPQGWDLLVSWVVERIRLRKLALRVPGMSTKRRTHGTRRGAGVEAAVAEEADVEASPDEGDEGGGGGSMKSRNGSRRATVELEKGDQTGTVDLHHLEQLGACPEEEPRRHRREQEERKNEAEANKANGENNSAEGESALQSQRQCRERDGGDPSFSPAAPSSSTPSSYHAASSSSAAHAILPPKGDNKSGGDGGKAASAAVAV